MSTTQDPQLYFHIRVVMGMVLGLSMTRLLSGVAKCFQNPQRYGLSVLHMGWVLALFLNVIQFWWWEFRLINIHRWTFELYLFIVIYTSLLYFMCVFIFPDELPADTTLEKYFFSQRKPFFILMALSSALSLIDIIIKRTEYSTINLYFVAISCLGMFALFLLAAHNANIWYHKTVMAMFFMVQVTGIAWLLHTLT